MKRILGVILALLFTQGVAFAAGPYPYGPPVTAPLIQQAYATTGAQPMTAQCASAQYSSCPPGSIVGTIAQGMGNVNVQVTGTFVGTLQFETSLDCVNFVQIQLNPQPSGSAVATTTATGKWSGTLTADICMQVRFTSYTSGTANVTISVSGAGGSVTSNGGGGGGCTAPCTVQQSTAANLQSTATPATFVPSSAPSLFFNNAAIATTVVVVPLAVGKATYLLSLTLNSAVTQTVTLEYGTGASCGTGTVNLGPFPVVAGSGIELGYTFIPSGQALCYVTSAAGQTAAIATGYQQ